MKYDCALQVAYVMSQCSLILFLIHHFSSPLVPAHPGKEQGW